MHVMSIMQYDTASAEFSVDIPAAWVQELEQKYDTAPSRLETAALPAYIRGVTDTRDQAITLNEATGVDYTVLEHEWRHVKQEEVFKSYGLTDAEREFLRPFIEGQAASTPNDTSYPCETAVYQDVITRYRETRENPFKEWLGDTVLVERVEPRTATVSLPVQHEEYWERYPVFNAVIPVAVYEEVDPERMIDALDAAETALNPETGDTPYADMLDEGMVFEVPETTTVYNGVIFSDI